MELRRFPAQHSVDSFYLLSNTEPSIPRLSIPRCMSYLSRMTKSFGEPHIHFDSIDSTNTRAKAMIRDGVPHGAAVTAGMQTAGRGRFDRVWESGPNLNLLVSYILFPQRDITEWGGLSLLSGISVVDSIRSAAGLYAHLKWPNDTLIRENKVSGILIETGVEQGLPWAVIGIGINVNQSKFPEALRIPATSLCLESHSTHRIEFLFAALSEMLERWYLVWLRDGNSPIVQAWKERSIMFGRPLHVIDGAKVTECRAVDLDVDGSLIIRTNDGQTARVHASDITVHYSEGAFPDA